MMSNLRHHIQKSNLSDEAKFLASLAYTLGSRRSVLPWTVAFTADSVKSLLSALDSEDTSPTRSVPEIRMGWVFTGQGAQWHAMGRELFATFPVFREAILECDGYIEEMGASWTITGKFHYIQYQKSVPPFFGIPGTDVKNPGLDRGTPSRRGDHPREQGRVQPASVNRHTDCTRTASLEMGTPAHRDNQSLQRRSSRGLRSWRPVGSVCHRGHLHPRCLDGEISIQAGRRDDGRGSGTK